MTSHGTAGKRLPLHYQILIAMLVGTGIGVLINRGEIRIDQPVTVEIQVTGDEVRLQEILHAESGGSPDSSETILFEKKFASRDGFARSYPRLNESLGDRTANSLPVKDGTARIQYGAGDVRVTWQRTHVLGDSEQDQIPAITDFKAATPEKLPDYWKALAGKHPADWRSHVTVIAKFLGDLFLRLLKMVTVPLIMTSLVTGVAGLGQHGRFGRMFSRTLLYYLVTSGLAITVGIVMVNLLQPGSGAVLPGGGETLAEPEGTLTEVLSQQLLRMIPV
ncbi:MAG: cation:dicarboxylase symporter family transporter, partial [Planctomycetaceae bacterium]|nr:cation:dicarboxylase symporter family transporter [Planctomycetaceae bacterium]